MLFMSGLAMLILSLVLFVFRAWWRKYCSLNEILCVKSVKSERVSFIFCTFKLTKVPVSMATYTRISSAVIDRFGHGYSFLRDRDAGFSSNTFDLSGNIESADTRQGLDNRAKREIKRIMRNQQISFDEARAIYTQQRFRDNDIGPDGRPTDPRAVFFS